MAESKEELKESLDEGERGEQKPGLKLSIQKRRSMASSPVTLWQIDRETMEIVTDYFLELQNHCGWSLPP